MATARSRDILRQYFLGLTEHAFMDTLGIGDPALTDYLAEMLTRFVHIDRLYVLHDAEGVRLEEVATMLLEAQGLPPEGRTRREVFRHIGDYTLFWTGVYPEALKKLRARNTKDSFIDYCAQGKRSYAIAGSYDEEPLNTEAPVLRRLSTEFELCAFGLNQIRKDFVSASTDIAEDGSLRRVIH